MPDPQKPLLSAAELEALIQNWGSIPHQSEDKFFPLRFWYLAIITFSYVIWLLFFTDTVVQLMTTQPTEVARMGRFLYFRGWFLLMVLGIGLYSYFEDWYFAIIFSSLFLAGCVNFVFDLFNVYFEALSNPTPRTTLLLIFRLIALWFVYLNVKNSSRLPALKDRMNLMLLFRKGA